MKIPEGATHYYGGQFYKLTWFGHGYYTLLHGYWEECTPIEDAWPIEGLTRLALEVEQWWPQTSLLTKYTHEEWYMRRLELGLEKIRTLGGNIEDFEITYYKLSGGAQEKIMAALLMSMGVMTRVLDGEECYSAASSTYCFIEEALEAMEKIEE